jgi:hypothetical protein
LTEEINADAFIGNGLVIDDDMMRPAPTQLTGWGDAEEFGLEDEQPVGQIVFGVPPEPEPVKPEPQPNPEAALLMVMIWQSRTTGKPHVVTTGIWHCTCEAFVLGGRECWAVKASKELIGA